MKLLLIFPILSFLFVSPRAESLGDVMGSGKLKVRLTPWELYTLTDTVLGIVASECNSTNTPNLHKMKSFIARQLIPAGHPDASKYSHPTFLPTYAKMLECSQRKQERNNKDDSNAEKSNQNPKEMLGSFSPNEEPSSDSSLKLFMEKVQGEDRKHGGEPMILPSAEPHNKKGTPPLVLDQFKPVPKEKSTGERPEVKGRNFDEVNLRPKSESHESEKVNPKKSSVWSFMKSVAHRVKSWFTLRKRRELRIDTKSITIDDDDNATQIDAVQLMESRTDFGEMVQVLTKAIVEGDCFPGSEFQNQVEFIKDGLQDVLYWILRANPSKIIRSAKEFLKDGKILENLNQCYGKSNNGLVIA